MTAALLATDPKALGPYRLLGRLGGGGMGQVFLAKSPGGRLVAVKVIRPEYAADPVFRTRFAREVANAKNVNGMFTAVLVDADTDGPVPWLAAAYIPGPSLANAVRESGPLPSATAAPLAAGLAEALAAIHAAGVVHRDLKPSNVLLASDGPRVIDFGISHAVESSRLTQSGAIIGSPGYMSPEQAQGRPVGPASDIFSLGAVLAFAVAGAAPFGVGSAAALVYRVVNEAPDLDRVPPELRRLIERCLAKEPGERPSPGDLLSELGGEVIPENWLPETVADTIPRYEPSARIAALVDAGPPRTGAPAPETPTPGIPVTETLSLEIRARGNAAQTTAVEMPAPETAAPTGVRERLSLRAEAVQRVPDLVTAGDAPEPDVPAAPTAAAERAEQVVAPRVAPERPKRRAFRVLVIPLTVAATAGAVALVPYILTPHPGGSPTASGGGATTSAVATVGTPSASATASVSPSSTRPGGSTSPRASGGAGASSTSGSGSGGTGSSGTSNGSGSSSVTSAGSGSSTSGASGGSGGSQGGSASPNVTASGTHRLESALDGKCLAANPTHSTSGYLADCASSSPFEWTYTAVSGGTFELWNPTSSNCLAGSGDNFTYMVPCGSTNADVWRFGPSTSSGATLENPSAGQCLQNDTAMGGYAVLTSCGSSADLVWSNK